MSARTAWISSGVGGSPTRSKCHSAEQRPPVGSRRWRQTALGQLRQDEAVDRRAGAFRQGRFDQGTVSPMRGPIGPGNDPIPDSFHLNGAQHLAPRRHSLPRVRIAHSVQQFTLVGFARHHGSVAGSKLLGRGLPAVQPEPGPCLTWPVALDTTSQQRLNVALEIGSRHGFLGQEQTGKRQSRRQQKGVPGA